jgi:predicted metal-dependent enzyme (double-stranded beta helix superfamily)
MFSIEQLVDDCRAALRDSMPAAAIKEVVARIVAQPADLVSVLGAPRRAGLFPIHQSADLTILNVVWAPGMSIYPHDHRMWAVIGVYAGTEDNVFYRRTPEGLVRAAARRLEAGATAMLGAETVHAVANPLGSSTGAIQVYGGDFFGVSRSEFDPLTLAERPFDVEKAKSLFAAANGASGERARP